MLSMDRRIWIIFLIMFTNFLGVGIIFPFLPYYAEHVGANILTISFLAIAYPACSLISAPILGNLSDTYGRRPILLFSVLGTIIGFIILGFAKTLPLLFFSRIIDGSSAGNTPTALAYVADITTEKERTHAMSIITSSFWSGIALGFILGGLLSGYGYAIPSFIAVAITTIGLLLAYFFLPESYIPTAKHSNNSKTFSLKYFVTTFSHPIITTLFLVVFIKEFLSWFYDSTASLFLEHVFHATAQQVGFVFSYIAIIGTVMQLVAVKLLLRFMKEQTIMVFCFLLIIVGLLFLSFGSTLGYFLIGTTIVTIGFSITGPVSTALVSLYASKHEQGRAMGVLDTVRTVGTLLGPLIGLYLFSLQMRLRYYAGIGIGLCALFFSMYLLMLKRK